MQVRQQEKDIMALRSMATSSAPVPLNVDSIRRELDAVNERIKRVDASLELERKQVRDNIIHRPSSIIHHPPSIIHHPSSTVHHPSSIIHHPPSIIHHPSSIIHRPSSIIHYPSSIIHYPSSIHARGHSFSNSERINFQLHILHVKKLTK
jgi:hypothetical protein